MSPAEGIFLNIDLSNVSLITIEYEVHDCESVCVTVSQG